MNNWKTATDATKTALNSQGSAAREQEAYMNSYEARINGLKTRFTELSLAIGKRGQNARLAAKLTGYRIDIKSETAYEEYLENLANPVVEETEEASSEEE